MVVTTRRATLNDAEAVALAHVRGWQVGYQGLVPDSILDAIDLDQRTAQWQHYLTNDVPTDYVAELNGQVVGFANVGPFRGEAVNDSYGELWAMYVHPDHWGAGAGYALMQCTMAYFVAHGMTTGYLWVLEGNDRARRFYERQGWIANLKTAANDYDGVSLLERRYSIRV